MAKEKTDGIVMVILDNICWVLLGIVVGLTLVSNKVNETTIDSLENTIRLQQEMLGDPHHCVSLCEEYMKAIGVI